ncbi:MAG: histidine phosphatase family protein [Proteobacteria bacterium]|nr:histidine phosphatase family protein [Pseudomonadota bacterium]MBU1612127.1 histidine phosphatase family protein [Pseudomonadota bacterium]
MRIYLMQHGVCLPKEVDPEQGLSPVGREEVETTARAVARMGIGFTDIFASPKKRALQTARLMALVAGYPEEDVLVHEDITARTEPERTLRRLQELATGSSLLVCGHLPNLNLVACRLLTPGPDFKIAIKNAGLICLSMDRLPTNSASLEWQLRPEQLLELAG